MYIFGIDVQLNILVLLNLLAALVELFLVWRIMKKLRKKAEHKAAQRELEDEWEEVSGE
ncbi:MAG: hypothetical protein QXM31_03925 [Candidatus Woesearchaeota archaeon]